MWGVACILWLNLWLSVYNDEYVPESAVTAFPNSTNTHLNLHNLDNTMLAGIMKVFRCIGRTVSTMAQEPATFKREEQESSNELREEIAAIVRDVKVLKSDHHTSTNRRLSGEVDDQRSQSRGIIILLRMGSGYWSDLGYLVGRGTGESAGLVALEF